jgi:SulP family sulfate permease
MILAALLFIRKVAVTTTVSQATPDYVEAGRAHSLQDKEIPPYVAIFRIHGPFLFGVTDKLARITDNIEQLPPIVVVRLRNMTAIDATGVRALEDLAHRLRAARRTLLVCGAQPQPAAVMEASQFHLLVGASNICSSVETALARAREIHEQSLPALARQAV